MRLRTLSAFVTVLCLAGVSAAGEPEDALLAFDGLCIATDAKLSTIERIATAAGAKPVPQHLLNQDTAIADSGGKAFAFDSRRPKYIVAATFAGACSIMFPDVNAAVLQRLLESNYALTKPRIESSGPQVTSVYRVVAPSVRSGSYVMLMVPKPGFGADKAVSLGFIPAATAEKLGISKSP